MYLDMNSATGTVWFDGMQLEEGESANDVNLVDDSDLKLPGAWITNNARDFSGGFCRFTPNIDSSVNNCYVYQTIQVNAADVCFNVYGTASADSVSLLHEGRAFSMELAIEYADGVGEWQSKPFNEAVSERQQVNLNVRPQRKGVVVSKVGVYFVYRANANAAIVDNMMVTIDRTGTTYDYDSEGNLISAADNGSRNQAYTFNNAHELTEYTDAKNETYKYNYAQDNKHRVESAISVQLMNGYRYTYDNAGNIVGVTMNSKMNDDGTVQDNNITMSAATEYDGNKNYVVKQTDTRGKSVTYDVNGSNGLVNRSTAPIGTGGTASVDYSYNADTYQTTRVSRTVDGETVSNFFGYDSLRRLTSIYHNGFNYNLGYDQWGNRTTTKIQDQQLSSNTYNANNGTLAKTTYGNGDYLSYDYDRYDRVTKKTSEKGVLAEYVYNNRGLPARVTDRTRPGDVRVTEYQYDLLGRLETAYQTGSRPVESRYSYDKVNRFTGETVVTSGGDHAWGVSYGKDNQVTESAQGRFTFKYSYDGLGRRYQDSVMVDGGSPAKVFTRYLYESGANGNESPLVRGLAFLKPGYIDQGTLDYTYDDAGNIRTIRENGVLKATYTYDSLNQLVREDNAWADRTYIYVYDNGGNIIEWREHPYTATNIFGEPSVDQFYGYDSVWKDRLEHINGHEIAYDGIGNPLNWYPDISNMKWDNGRQLTSLQKRTSLISYRYDESGLRIGKQAGSVMTYSDRDANGKLVHEKIGTHDLFYYYDADGSVGSISYDYTRYAFRKNLQGDVIAILDTNGDVVARYAYDAWGKVLSVTDKNGNAITDANHVANINPIRYRGYYYDTETGWYYLNSRYYDPSVKRFINADGIIGANGNFTGMNLFAYCNNNPVIFGDPTGEWVALLGLTGGGAAIIGADISGYVVIDSEGNIGLQWAHSEINANAGFNIGAGVTFGGYWNADTIYDLVGTSVEAGISVSPFDPPVSVGADVIWNQDGDKIPDGFTGTVSLGVGVDGHVKTQKTYQGPSTNIFGKSKGAKVTSLPPSKPTKRGSYVVDINEFLHVKPQQSYVSPKRTSWDNQDKSSRVMHHYGRY